MTFEEYNKRFADAIRKVETDLGKTMVKIGADALRSIKKRAGEDGIDAEGGSFPPYSIGKDIKVIDPKTKKEKTIKGMLVGDKSFRSKDSKGFFSKDHYWKTIKRGGKIHRLAILEGGYQELRNITLGRDFGQKVNFSFTNAMWGDIHIISNQSDHDSGTVIIGALRKEEQDKLYYNTKRNKDKGGNDILDLSKDEIEDIKKLYEVEILNIFKSSGL